MSKDGPRRLRQTHPNPRPTGKKRLITVAIPCYNEEDNIVKVYAVLIRELSQLKRYSFELVFVDNGSRDRTRELITSLALKDKRVKAVCLARNFGPEASTQAGLDVANGDAAILYECDMQDPPELIRDFVAKWEEGYEIVAGVRTKIDDGVIMTFFRRVFYKILRAVSDIDVPVNSGHFSLIGGKALTAMRALPERYRFFRGIRAWLGFKTAYITYERRKRLYGKSAHNFYSYFKYAEHSLFGFTYMPLDFLVYLGFFLTALSFIIIIGFFAYFVQSGRGIDSTTIILTAIVFFGGVQLLALSVIGKYIQVIMEETKARPTYIIDQIVQR